ncbi:MAG TPA: DNA mismatch repair protein MutS [Thermoanaerobaculia bacterium]|nr:DNA mismatch repair protein MutS [Thermoanaerobaculia bacterium]
MRTTPMLEQYWALKQEVPDAILLYRLGDFYEMFFEDAEAAAPLLGLVLTARHRDTDIEAPMCGVPHHALESYVARLVGAGRKVAIAEQTEAPQKGKTLVARKIVRVLTPGTLVDPERLDAKQANDLAAIALTAGEPALAYLDLSTGDFCVIRLDGTPPAEMLSRRTAKELVAFPSEREEVARLLEPLGSDAPVLSVLAAESPRGRSAADLLEGHFRTTTLAGFGLPPAGPLVDAAAAVLSYARSTQKADCVHVTTLRTESAGEGLVVDAVTQGHLELFRSLRDGGRTGTLLSVVDRTGTPFGARALRRVLEQPLGSQGAIECRLDAVEELVSGPSRLEPLGTALGTLPDLPRLLARVAVGSATPRDLSALGLGLARATALCPLLDGSVATLLSAGGGAYPEGVPDALAAHLAATLVETPPVSSKEGGLVRDGVDGTVDGLRKLRLDAATLLGALEAAERSRRGIPTLRVKFNQVFGHVFEVPGSARAKIPEDAVKRQTLASVERYATAELVTLDEKLRSADERLAEREAEIFRELCDAAMAEADAVGALSTRLALLDVLVSLARVARAERWCRPRLVAEPVLSIEGGRHPVVEALRRRESFVPNDTELGGEARVVILTGPNMGGKSTYLRQNALVVLLAHAGSFVPAAAATVGLCDRIFTRVGASDSLARGESTFLTEMAETAHILRHATPSSLVVLDEIGRGTATFDGLSLAWAIAEHLHDAPGAPSRVLFATHYHELTELALVRAGVKNRTMAVKEWKGEVVFLRKVVDGVADRSYGVQVAKLAGIPAAVTERAKEILRNLEKQQLDVGGRPRLAEHAGAPPPTDVQLDLFRGQEGVVVDALRRLDLDTLTPLAALNVLASLRARLEGTE